MRLFQLGRALGWEKSRISHQVTPMVERGLVEKSKCGSDRRGAFVAVTDAGAAGDPRRGAEPPRGRAAPVRGPPYAVSAGQRGRGGRDGPGCRGRRGAEEPVPRAGHEPCAGEDGEGPARLDRTARLAEARSQAPGVRRQGSETSGRRARWLGGTGSPAGGGGALGSALRASIRRRRWACESLSKRSAIRGRSRWSPSRTSAGNGPGSTSIAAAKAHAGELLAQQADLRPPWASPAGGSRGGHPPSADEW